MVVRVGPNTKGCYHLICSFRVHRTRRSFAAGQCVRNGQSHITRQRMAAGRLPFELIHSSLPSPQYYSSHPPLFPTSRPMASTSSCIVLVGPPCSRISLFDFYGVLVAPLPVFLPVSSCWSPFQDRVPFPAFIFICVCRLTRSPVIFTGANFIFGARISTKARNPCSIQRV